MNKNRISNGFKWSAIERVITQGLQLIIMIVLARMAGPTAYGIIGIVAVFIAVAQTLVDGGFSSALIRRKNVTKAEYNSVFLFNIIMSLILYGLLVFTTGIISNFYHEPLLNEVLPILGISIILNSGTVIQRAILTIDLDFKTQSKISILSVVISGATSILMAIYGFGIWSLVANVIILSFLSLLFSYLWCSWRPSFEFDFISARKLLSFGYKLSLASLLNTVFDNIYNLAIGKYYSPIDVGYFSQAKTLTLTPTNTYSSIIQRVTYRYFSEIAEDKEKYRDDYIKILSFSMFLYFPLILSLAFFSKDIVLILFGVNWLFSAKIISLLSFCYMWYPLHALNLNILNVHGRSDVFLKLEVLKKILILILLVFSIQHGIEYVCYGMILYSLISIYINAAFTNRIIGVTIFKQLKSISPYLIFSSISISIGFFIASSFFDGVGGIILLPVSISFYFLICYFCKLSPCIFLLRYFFKKNQ